MYRRLITVFIALLALSALPGFVSAQQTKQEINNKSQDKAPEIEVGDKELDKFVSAVDKVKEIQKTAQKKMIDAIESEGLDTKKFVQIRNMEQNPKADAGDKISDDDMESYNKAKEKLATIQKEIQQKQVEAIQNEGIGVKRYVQIAKAAQNDSTLLQRIKDKQKEE